MATNIVNSLMEKASKWAKLGQDDNGKKKSPKKKPKVFGEDYDDPTEELTEANLAGIKKRKKSAQKKKLSKLAEESVADYTRQSSGEGDFALSKGRYSQARKIRKIRS